MKKEITDCLVWYANELEKAVQYFSSNEVCFARYIDGVRNAFMEELRKHIDFNSLTKKEALELRFGKWDDDQPNLYLIPLYLLPIVPVGTELTTITGGKIIYNGTNVDKDTRFGCLAYGIELYN